MKAQRTPPEVDNCPTIRLASGELATVDMCSCGMLRLHLGAVTLRLTPDALESISATIGDALSTQLALRTPPRLLRSGGSTAATSATEASDSALKLNPPVLATKRVRGQS
jgi:hypothetical protein